MKDCQNCSFAFDLLQWIDDLHSENFQLKQKIAVLEDRLSRKPRRY